MQEESAGCWTSYNGQGYFPEMTKKGNALPFLMLSPPPSRRVLCMQPPVVVCNTPSRWVFTHLHIKMNIISMIESSSSDEFMRQNIDCMVESQLRFPF